MHGGPDIGTRAATSKIGSLLMVAVVVGAVATSAAYGALTLTDVLGCQSPTATVNVEYDATKGEFDVIHEGGDTFDDGNTGRITIKVTDESSGRSETHPFAGTGGAGTSFPVQTGDLVTVDGAGGNATGAFTVGWQLEAGDTVEVVWHGTGEGCTSSLASYKIPSNSKAAIPLVQGLRYEYFEADSDYTSLSDFKGDSPVDTGVVSNVNISVRQRGSNYAFRFTGYLKVPEDGTYTLYTRSDDGSRFYVDGNLVVDNPGLHAARTRSGTVTLEEGHHKITVTMFEHTGSEVLSLSWAGPSFSKQPIPDANLKRRATPVARFSATCGGKDCSFDASGSTPGGGSITDYDWEFGDGNTSTTNSPTINHTYGSTGTFNVTLTVTDSKGRTDSVTRSVDIDKLRSPDSPSSTASGLEYEYYEASGEFTSMPDFDTMSPTKTGVVSGFDISVRDRGTDYAFRFTGYIEIPKDGEYTFWTASDDGSELFIGSTKVVNNPGLHARRERSGSIDLAAGKHEITVTMFEHHGSEVIDVYWSGPNFSKELVPQSRLSYNTSSPSLSPPASASTKAGPGRWKLSVSPEIGQSTGIRQSWELSSGVVDAMSTPALGVEEGGVRVMPAPPAGDSNPWLVPTQEVGETVAWIASAQAAPATRQR